MVPASLTMRSTTQSPEIKEFAVFGERCSGTNLVEQLVLRNFPSLTRLRTYPWEKHSYVNVPVAGERTLAIVAVREPLRWMQSLYRNPHQVGRWRRNASFTEFLRAEWSSVVNGAVIERQRKHGIKGRELMLDRHPMTGMRPRNIVELRNWKLESYRKVPLLYENWVFVRFEDVCTDPADWVRGLSEDFGLDLGGPIETISEDVSRPTGFDRATTPYPEFTAEDRLFVMSELNLKQEKEFGYLI